jgi:hypothetical protein
MPDAAAGDRRGVGEFGRGAEELPVSGYTDRRQLELLAVRVIVFLPAGRSPARVSPGR